MGHKKFVQNTLLLFLVLSFLGLSQYFFKQTKKPLITVSKQQSALNTSPMLIDLFNLGNKRMLTSILWISTLIESDLDHYKGKDLNSWMFLRFKQILQLDPWFYSAYRFGGLYLSVVKDDIPGATYIYDHGLEKYPNDYALNFYGGNHYYFEEGNAEKAIAAFEKIQNHEFAPFYLASLIAKIKHSEGIPLKQIYYSLLEAYNNSPNIESIRKYYREKLYALKAQLDLECLNNKKNVKCDLKDFDGNTYIKKDGKYKSTKKWKK